MIFDSDIFMTHVYIHEWPGKVKYSQMILFLSLFLRDPASSLKTITYFKMFTLPIKERVWVKATENLNASLPGLCGE